MHRPEVKKLEALALLAQDNARRRRSPLMITLLVAILLGPVVLFFWWIWPGPPPSALVLAVYDQVALPDEPVPVCAQLQPVEPTGASENLSGYPVYFQDSK